jgi:hypothetical protein
MLHQSKKFLINKSANQGGKQLDLQVQGSIFAEDRRFVGSSRLMALASQARARGCRERLKRRQNPTAPAFSAGLFIRLPICLVAHAMAWSVRIPGTYTHFQPKLESFASQKIGA